MKPRDASPFERRRAACRTVWDLRRAIVRRRRCSWLEASDLVRDTVGVNLRGWHVLTDATHHDERPPLLALERLRELGERFGLQLDPAAWR